MYVLSNYLFVASGSAFTNFANWYSIDLYNYSTRRLNLAILSTVYTLEGPGPPLQFEALPRRVFEQLQLEGSRSTDGIP